MSPRHFSKMYQNKGQHGHDQISDWDSFSKDMTVLTGMLYTIAKWPIKPFLPAFYKTAAEVKKDYEPLYNPPIEE
jgi:hypothetical protein